MKAIYKVSSEKVIGYKITVRSWELSDLPMAGFGMYMRQYHILEVGITDIHGREHTFYPYKHTDELLFWDGSLQEWFDSIAGRALDTLSVGFPVLEFDYTHWQPVAYNPEVCYVLTPPKTHPSQDFSLDDASDYVVTMPEKYHTKYLNNTLYTVDGLWVPHVYEPYGVRLIGGGDIAKQSKGGNIGVVVFGDVGNVNTHILGKDDVVRIDTSRNMHTTLLIKSPESITGKSVGFVFAGHLTWLKPIDCLSDTSVQYSMANRNILDWLIETQYRYDWDLLGLGDFSSGTSVNKILSDETIKKILAHSSTFLIVVDNPYLQNTTTAVGERGAVGRFRIDDKGRSLKLGYLTNTLGYAVEYWPVWDLGVWTLHTTEGGRDNPVYKSAKWKTQTKINDARQHQYQYVLPHMTMNVLKARKK